VSGDLGIPRLQAGEDVKLLHDQGDPASVVQVWTTGDGRSGWHCSECGTQWNWDSSDVAWARERALQDAAAHRCPPGETGEQYMTAYWNTERMAAAAQERDSELAQAEKKRVAAVSASDLRGQFVTGALTGRVCWGPHPPGQAWPCGCTPVTRYGNLADIPDPPAHPAGVITTITAGGSGGSSSDSTCTCGCWHISDWRVHASACPRGGELARQAAGKTAGGTGQVTITPYAPSQPADSQEALHREVTGRTPPPTLEGWRDEFVALGGDYAKQRMLSYVTLDTRCVTDPPGKTPPRSGTVTRPSPRPVPRADAGQAWRPRIRDRKSALISAVAIALLLLVAAGAYTPAALLTIILAVVAWVRR
jgi:hypothetical protein